MAALLGGIVVVTIICAVMALAGIGCLVAAIWSETEW
jgi:hypothetical protein